ncbi:MAG: T9SS type A sorting domain-containing protein [candidate division Zixibacteria bacterium]|nr:T9SS type A sorting domain-containing protein [candidate division Zixibacteria bacterium]
MVQYNKGSFIEGYPTISIEKTHNTYQGQYEDVSITIDNTILAMGGFNFLIAYDASALAFTEATPGQLLADCEWEYFTYRYGVDGNCGDACPSGLLRIFAIAETNNGPNHPSCYGPPDYEPHELAKIRFLVTNDRTFECMYVPIYFFWTDCGDNTVSSVDGENLYIDHAIYDSWESLIWDEEDDDEFPEDERLPHVGAPDYCINPDPDKPTPIRYIDFMFGGINIVCADSIDDRGDINLNGVVNEVADAVLFSNYFVHGISVFNVNIDGQIAASDVNADGITLSVADLVYLIRIIVGDALPYPKLSPVMAEADLVSGVLSVNADMGAAYVVVENSVTPLLLAESMEMKYHYDEVNNLTRVLVYSMKPDSRFSGEFLGGIEGNVITLEMATYEGAPVTTKLVPDAFALYPCYPNPFNPITTISFALASPVDYELVIYNALGQTVETFDGHAGPGLERVDWNASGYASGVYFYRLTAGDFNDTKKMVLLK